MEGAESMAQALLRARNILMLALTTGQLLKSDRKKIQSLFSEHVGLSENVVAFLSEPGNEDSELLEANARFIERLPFPITTFDEYREIMRQLLAEIQTFAPELPVRFYLGGTMPVSCEHLHHVISLDIDLHTKAALAPTHEEASQLRKGFKKRLTWLEVDRDFGIYRGLITTHSLSGAEVQISLDLMSNIEDATNLCPLTFCDLSTPSLEAHIATKLQCLEERSEPKDLLHLFFLRSHSEALHKAIDNALKRVDPIFLAQNLQSALRADDEIRKTRPHIPGLSPFNVLHFNQWLQFHLASLKQEKTKYVENEPEP